MEVSDIERRARLGHVTLLVVLAVTLFATAPAALAGPREEMIGGTILFAHPLFTASGLSTSGSSPNPSCDTRSSLNGIDALMLKVHKGWAHFTLEPASTLEAYVYFYTRDCKFAGRSEEGWGDDYGFYPETGDTRTGSVPAGTAFAYVIGLLGTGSFTLQLSS